MRASRSYGSVRGALSNGRPYRDMTELYIGSTRGSANHQLPDWQRMRNHSGIQRVSAAVIGSDAYTKWLEQCRATTTIRERYGLKSAFDYLVSEKLLDFARAAEREPELARQPPRFVSEVRRIFEADEVRVHLARVEREQEALELE